MDEDIKKSGETKETASSTSTIRPDALRRAFIRQNASVKKQAGRKKTKS
ncbi:hypothetical protein MCHI_000389 [Candidatus Magnetoovum chiemensis]|nr:hypothetical protein MCHI_000389 [Candidatus Magnetoovum chiemensis]